MIIKCPECGHQVSDKAPLCPNCGVQIAGNVIRCNHCGEVYLSEDGFCPSCHYSNDSQTAVGNSSTPKTDTPKESQGKPTPTPVPSPNGQRQTPKQDNKVEKQDKETQKPVKKKPSSSAIIVSIVIALIVCGVASYMYKQAQDRHELEEWQTAMKSSDPLLLQQYLNTFKDANEAHRDSILAHLHAIQQRDDDWANAVASNTKEALEEYLSKHPESNHKLEAKLKIDSIDWVYALNTNTVEGYQEYMRVHDDGEHYDEADEAMKKIKAKEITGDEKAMARGVLRTFFLGLNEHSEDAVKSAVAEQLTLLDKPNATKSDVVDMMNRLYKEGVSSMIWALGDGYDVKKREVGDDQYEYTISISATQTVRYTDPSRDEKNNYRINATINPNHKISQLRMTKHVEEKKEEPKVEEKPAAQQ